MLVLMGLYIYIYTPFWTPSSGFNQASLDLASKRKDVDTSSSKETMDKSSQSASVSQIKSQSFFAPKNPRVFSGGGFFGCIGREGWEIPE